MPRPSGPAQDPTLGSLVAELRRLLNLGYRMLGSVQDAEDVVQETYARWYTLSEERQRGIGSPPTWLTRVAKGGDDPADRITLDESVGMGMLVILESITPAERVAFVLHDVFGVPFAEIAETVGRTPVACQQLAASARRRIARQQPGSGAREAARGARPCVRSSAGTIWPASSSASCAQGTRGGARQGRRQRHPRPDLPLS
ncbi:sigma factor [Streptomyces scopuliridis]|uniref:sigma factor n=1 Tax=Streptomyces scopuliridis TaxID=452529 RepID=UPI0036A22304